MEFRILGGHQVSSREGRATSFLIDGAIALDAGGLADGLTLAEQDRIEQILITHLHYDHVRDLPLVGLAALNRRRQIDVYCTMQVRQTLQKHLLCKPLWLDFFAGLDPDRPTFRHHNVKPGVPFLLGELEITPIDNRHHTVPVTGFELRAPSGRRLLYTGDTGQGIRDVWPLVEPAVLITEVTFPDQLAQLAEQSGHLTPALLEHELRAFASLKGYLPRVVICHVNQMHEAIVVNELEGVARRLRAEIEIASEGMQIEL